ncbi:MAG: hypothetical protein WDW38_009703 [Sanguina aurantia]
MAKKPPEGLVHRAYNAVVDLFLKKEVVGFDKAGNKYFRYFENMDGLKKERREVKWASPHMYYDPNEIPPEWRMWLRKLRENPPTEEEVSMGEQRSETMRVKVAAIDEADRLRRYQMASTGSQGAAPAEPNMAQFLQQMRPAGSASASASAAPGQASTPPSPSPPSAKETPSGEATGTGSSYTPGAWKPGG